jgi:maltooligosyltrehalose trehalohydrolase
VEVVVDGRRLPMSRSQKSLNEANAAADGWWETGVLDLEAGARYGFSLDRGDARPDPRSQSQPGGVLALSEAFGAGGHRWSDGGWRGRPLAGLVLYELHVGTFTPAGTFDAVIDRLPHLVALGVDAIELMPVVEFSGDRGWGYDGVDLFAPHHAYGGPAGLKRLVDASHAAGLAVVLDVVYNHLGPIGNFLSEFGPYFSDRHQTAWGAALNFDGPGAEEVRRFVIDNAVMWIRDYHVDGLRLDAVHSIVDESDVHLLTELADAVRATARELGRSAFVIAEDERNDPRLCRSKSEGGYGLDAAWADDWHHALHTVLTGERAGYYEDFGSFEQLAKALRQAWVYDGIPSARRGAVRGSSPCGLPPERFVVATQNHDQVGNRAAGERLAALAGEAKAKMAAALLLTSPFTPMLFQGEEWAAGSPFQYFTDHADATVGRAVSEGRRHEFQAFDWRPEDVPDPQDPATFERSRLNWGELTRSPHADMLDWYRRLIAFRRTLPAPRGGVGEQVEVTVDARARTVRFARPGVAVFANLGDHDWRLPDGLGPAVVASRAGAGAVRPDGVAVFEAGADA